MEQIQYYIHRGIWESRAGVIWGPFSEIYGFGAVVIFLLSNIIKNSSPITVFCVSSISGSAFEYLASLFQEIFLGSSTWNYSKEPFNFGGRTSLKYGVYWGILGLLFIKWIFPMLNRSLESIRGKFAFTLTLIFIVFMTCNLIASSLAVNRWNERVLDIPAKGFIDDYFDHHYDDQRMHNIFPHLKFIDHNGQRIK